MEREDPRDVFISRKAKSIAELPRGATVGTASLRRQAMVKRLRPDLVIVPLRGNVETRLRKLDEGVADATLLALAGLEAARPRRRRDRGARRREFLPAVGQGAIGIETRADDRGRANCSRRSITPTRSARWPPSARSSPCSTARAARRSAATRRSSGGTDPLSRHDREAGRQRSVRGDARRRRARCRKARRRCRRRIEGPRRSRFFRVLTMRLLVTRPEPDNARTAAALRAQGP